MIKVSYSCCVVKLILLSTEETTTSLPFDGELHLVTLEQNMSNTRNNNKGSLEYKQAQVYVT